MTIESVQTRQDPEITPQMLDCFDKLLTLEDERAHMIEALENGEQNLAKKMASELLGRSIVIQTEKGTPFQYERVAVGYNAFNLERRHNRDNTTPASE